MNKCIHLSIDWPKRFDQRTSLLCSLENERDVPLVTVRGSRSALEKPTTRGRERSQSRGGPWAAPVSREGRPRRHGTHLIYVRKSPINRHAIGARAKSRKCPLRGPDKYGGGEGRFVPYARAGQMATKHTRRGGAKFESAAPLVVQRSNRNVEPPHASGSPNSRQSFLPREESGQGGGEERADGSRGRFATDCTLHTDFLISFHGNIDIVHSLCGGP